MLFLKRNEQYINSKKIIYALTPTKGLSNIGDHAQVVAIYKWLKANYPDLPIMEVDKDECIKQIEALKSIIQKDDIIFIHSGGNLGDRGIWSETGRRSLIMAFPENKIVVLPQTIYFSNTNKGNSEKAISQRIYNAHNNLKVIARDYESLKLAKEIFPNNHPIAIPDFVLSLNVSDFIEKQVEESVQYLFCLRKDDESIFTEEERLKFPEIMNTDSYDFFDTTLEHSLPIDQREAYVKSTLEYFSKFKFIVTDRFHGLIFATLLNKPILVLPTVDHKLTSAIEWFKDMPQIKLIRKEELSDIKQLVSSLKSVEPQYINWKALYFDNLKDKL